VHHVASSANPYHWLLVIGVLLIVTVLFAPNGLVQLLENADDLFRRPKPGARDTPKPALRNLAEERGGP